MIYTLTLNPAIDKTVIIPDFAEGGVNRIESIRTDIGGKGINVSKCLLSLGFVSTAIAVWAGENGQKGKNFLKKSGFASYSIELDEGETRTNLKIIDPSKKINTDINEPGPDVSPEDLNKFSEYLENTVKKGDILVLSGSVPRGTENTIYRDIILKCNAKGIKTILDADGECFEYGIRAKPDFIKPNIDELCRYKGRILETQDEIIFVSRELIAEGIKDVVVSLGAEGALYITEDKCYKAEALKVPVQSTVGAGDSMVAALAYGIESALDKKESLRLATAISAASVMCSGTQAPEAETIRKLYEEVKITEI